MILLVEDCLVFLEEDCVVFLEDDCLVEDLESFLKQSTIILFSH
jgi:hypothetical protein